MIKLTPWKFNIALKTRQSQKETHLPTIIFQGRAVKRREGIFFITTNKADLRTFDVY